MDNDRAYDVIVVGAGAGGLLAAGRAGELGARVLLLEKMDRPGRKLLVTGQERCNVSNTAPLEEFLPHFGPQGTWLRNAFHRFFREELLELLARYGVETQVERGGRIFPASNRAEDVLAALLAYARDGGVELRTGMAVQGVLKDRDGAVLGVRSPNGAISARAVVLATGGASWPVTGSTGDGYRWAAAMGHSVVPVRPGLVPLTVVERARARALQGASLRNVRIAFYAAALTALDTPHPPAPFASAFGEMLITHFGLSGPIVLGLSGQVVDALARGPVSAAIDLKPALTAEQLRARLQREFESHPQRSLRNTLKALLPHKLVDVFAQLSGVPPERPSHTLRAAERDALGALLKSFRWQVQGSLPISAAMITQGGVALDEVDPRRMASRRVPGLYLCGELLDLAADTGGYNLQAAFSTGYLAGEHAVQFAHEISAF